MNRRNFIKNATFGLFGFIINNKQLTNQNETEKQCNTIEKQQFIENPTENKTSQNFFQNGAIKIMVNSKEYYIPTYEYLG